MKRLVMLGCLLMLAAEIHAVREYRDFTDTQGRTIRGCVVSYDASKQMVTFERDNRKSARVPLNIFSEEDQKYIQEWEIARIFLKSSSLKISVKRKTRENNKAASTQTVAKRTVDDTYYEILLKNNSASVLNSFTIEYCIFYEQEERGSVGKGVYCGKISVDPIAPRGEKTIFTDAVSIFREELDSGYIWVSGTDNVQDGQVRGIWLRAHMDLPSQPKATREYCLPDSLGNSRHWTTSSVAVGMN